MFWFTRKTNIKEPQYLAKITHVVQSGYVELVQDVISVMVAYYDLGRMGAQQTHLTGHNMQP